MACVSGLAYASLLLDRVPDPRRDIGPPSRATARMPVGEVTLISVR